MTDPCHSHSNLSDSSQDCSNHAGTQVCLGLETPIEELISLIFKSLKINVSIEEYAKVFRNNLIQNVGHLKRLSPSRLQRLNLPILLEEELEKIINHARNEFTQPSVQIGLGQHNRDPTLTLSCPFTGSRENTRQKIQSSPRTKEELWSLSEKQKKLIKESWQSILSKDEKNPDPSKRGRSLLFEKFYENLFRVSPTSKKMFEDKGMAVQARALMQMLGMLVKGIDNPPLQVLKKLGAHHLIYGVEVHHYQSFAVALVDTLESILGQEIMTKETRDAWLALMGKISSLMLEGAKDVQEVSFKGWLTMYQTPKGIRNSRWKKFWATMDILNLMLYVDPNATKPKQVFTLSNVLEVDSEDGSLLPIPTEYCFVLKTEDLDLYFCVETREELQKWMDAIKWRIRAVQRSYKYKLVSHTQSMESATVHGTHSSHSTETSHSTSHLSLPSKNK
jgi:hemoglobin-like flavoprotein